MKTSVELSVVTSLYVSSPYVAEFYRQTCAAAQKLTPQYEIIFVNDGSPDDALEKAVVLQSQDPHVVVVDLSRNFGHHQALMTGLSYARGEIVFLIDCDMEEDPAWLSLFDQTLRTQGCDVVYGIQDRRKGGLFERFTGWFFYQIFNWLSSTSIAPNATTARLMSRRYVDGLLRFQEREIFLPGLVHLAGFHQVSQVVQKRSKGATTYSLARKIALFVNAVTSFSNKPLVLIFYTGLNICLAAGGYSLWLIWRRLRHGIPILGWPSLIVSIWLLGGLTIFFIGVLGIYLAKVFTEIKQRPRTIVRQVYPESRG